MYKYESKCIICGQNNTVELRTKAREYDMNDYIVIDKNKDNTYKCEIHIKCKQCKIKYNQVKNIDLKKYI